MTIHNKSAMIVVFNFKVNTLPNGASAFKVDPLSNGYARREFKPQFSTLLKA